MFIKSRPISNAKQHTHHQSSTHTHRHKRTTEGSNRGVTTSTPGQRVMVNIRLVRAWWACLHLARFQTFLKKFLTNKNFFTKFFSPQNFFHLKFFDYLWDRAWWTCLHLARFQTFLKKILTNKKFFYKILLPKYSFHIKFFQKFFEIGPGEHVFIWPNFNFSKKFSFTKIFLQNSS